jgi:ABC-type bacteriocin/lantibiotic exporter with double-glycine peptidase domain
MLLMRRHIPFLAQLSAADCGAACLAMLLCAHGRATRVAECRALLEPGRDGVSARALLRAARDFGLEARALRVSAEHVAQQALPAIAYWGGNHFVLVARHTARGFHILDPAEGPQTLSAEQFAAGFSGVLLTFNPGPAFTLRQRAPRSPGAHPLAALRELPQLPRLLGLLLLASLLLQLLGLALPLALALVVDRLLPGATSGIGIIAAALLGATVLQALIGYARTRLLIHLQIAGDTALADNFVRHLLRLPLPFFLARGSGDLAQRLAATAAVREALTTGLLATALDGLTALVYLAVLFALAPAFGFTALAVGLLQATIMWFVAPHLLALAQRSLTTRAEESNSLLEHLSGIATLKSLAAELSAYRRWRGQFERALQADRSRDQFVAAVDLGLSLLGGIAPLLLLWLGTGLVAAGSLSAGAMLGLVLAAIACIGALGGLAAAIPQFQVVAAQLERLSDVLAEPVESAATAAPPPLTGAIQLAGVDFRYDREAPLALHAINLTIQAGEFIAIVGRSGSGKTTLARLLLGLYTPEAGSINYNGVPLAALDPQRLRTQIGVVPQEIELFAGTISSNIALGAADATPDAIQAAVALACLSDEIARMPAGYATRVAEGGAGLPGGVRQRIALARALIRRPPVLLLDEATSQLDALTEQAIDANLRRLGCTRILITHRLSSAQHADRIVVIDQGRIVECGDHTGLLAQGGVYAALVGATVEATP